MKHFLWLLSALFFFGNAQAQNLDLSDEEAFALIEKNIKAIGLSENDLKNSRISSAFNNQFAGTQMVYLQQTHLGIPVQNAIQTLAFKNGKLVSAQGERIGNMPEAAGNAIYPQITPDQAAITAIQLKGGNASNLGAGRQENNKIFFDKKDFAFEDIQVELLWLPLKNYKDIRLVWQVFYAPLKSSDYWLISIDAMNNSFVHEYNLTIYCQFDTPDHHHSYDCSNEGAIANFASAQPVNAFSPQSTQATNLVGTANYLVVPFPAESPNHPGGTPAQVTNPWTMAPGNATTLGWHNDGITDYTSTRGNNAWVQEDRDNNNNTFGQSANSTTTPDPLNFIFTPDFTVAPTQTTPVPNQQFSMTNLFYWNNIIHDLTYIYGFDEVTGNFQNNNMGRGGSQNDYVIVDAQDGGGMNNANFATAPDGTRGRMQMYLWSGSGGIQKDGGLDNGIVVHEYAHGISIRTIGGRTNITCQSNEENMGEGTSDYFALMYTQNWATSDLNTGFATPRGVGTYAANQGPTGSGIRTRRYSTNWAVNSLSYTQTLNAESHTRGELWCAVLWDMTWNIINQTGVISPNLFDVNSNGGNVIALKLVMEGMKLSRCNPGFISARDAILAADEILYNGAYKCAIYEAFRRRGMGFLASEGSTDDITDQTPDYSYPLYHTLSQGNMVQVEEGQQITYTNTVWSPCQAVSNYRLTDTLPANVTYVSGGTYDATTRVVSFDVNLASGESQDYVFVVRVNNGTYYPTVTLLQETVTSATIDASVWSNTGTPAANVWTTSTAQSTSSPRSLYARDYDIQTDMLLATVNNYSLAAGSTPTLEFKHRYNTEANYDGGVVELSINNGPWIDAGPYMLSGFYNSVFASSFSNPLTGSPAYSGNSGAFVTTKLNLASFAGQNLKFRFRFVSDNNTDVGSTGGWYIDDINFINQPLVIMRSNLFNASGVRVNTIDSILPIVETTVCNPVEITTQPSAVTACAGSSATFTVTAGGTAPNYQWQVSTNGGTTWTDISGATSSVLTVNSTTTGQNGNLYRVIISNSCPSSITSNAVALQVQNPATISQQPSNANVCSGSNATFSVTAAGTGITYQWQLSNDGGANWTNITGATTASYTVTGVTAAMNGNLYRVVITGCSAPINSNNATLNVEESASITSHPAHANVCSGSDATFSVTTSGNGVTYQWQVSTNGGTTWTNITGATSATYTVSNVDASHHNNQYRVVINNTCATNVASSAATLTVNIAASLNSQPTSVTVCAGAPATFQITADGSANTYQWQVSTDGGNTWTNISGATATTYTIASTDASMHNNRYRVIVTSCAGDLPSNAATLNVNAPAVMDGQVADVTACVGNDATFTVSVSGTNPQYQWQVSTDGGNTWSNISGATGATLSVANVTAAHDGYQYRVQISNICTSTFNSNAATLTISATATITSHPQDVSTCDGTNATFSVTASGSNLGYQWQSSTDGGATWQDIASATSNSIVINNVTPANSGTMVRVLVSSCSPGVITSNTATLTVNSPALITTQPTSVSVCPGNDATFTVAATGINVTYQWQVSTNGGTSWTDIAGATNNTYTVTNTTAAQNGNMYMVVINGVCTVDATSFVATLNVTGNVAINSHPQNTSACVNGNANFQATATNANSYQWQVSTDGGNTWSNIAGATSATLSVSNITLADDQNQYRVVVTGSCDDATSNAGVLTVNSLPTVSATGPTQAVCSGTSVTLSGTGANTYTWDNNVTNGTPFTVTSTTTYTVTGTDANGCSASSTITVAVNPIPVVTITTTTTELEEGGSTVITATSNPAATSYTWYYNGEEIAGETGNTITVTSDEAGDYTATVNVNDCSGSSNALTITVRAPNFAFISPNPNNGTFYVRMSNSGLSTNAKRMVMVYDAKGARVFAKPFNATVANSFDTYEIELGNVAAGVYSLVVYENGVFKKSAQVYINR